MVLLPPVNLIKKPKTIDDLPQLPLAQMGVRLYVLGALAWDYVGTILDISSQLDRHKTRKLTQAVRTLKLEFDKERQYTLSPFWRKTEQEFALAFEEYCQCHISKLSFGIDMDKSMVGLTDEYRLLVKAVQMALTVIDSIKLYANECDQWIQANGVYDRTMYDSCYYRLSILLPQFAGDAYNPNVEARDTTARILYNEIRQIEVNEVYE